MEDGMGDYALNMYTKPKRFDTAAEMFVGDVHVATDKTGAYRFVQASDTAPHVFAQAAVAFFDQMYAA
jgi:hypothetical protein